MRNSNILIILLVTLLSLTESCKSSKTFEDNPEKIRYTIELAIKRDARKMNEIIWEFNDYKANGIDNAEKLSGMYNDALKTKSVCIELIKNLDDIKSDINLKKEALEYFDFSESFLEDFIKPMAKTSLTDLQENTELQMKMKNSVIKNTEVSQTMSDRILEFCKEHNLEMELSEFDKNKFKEEIEELERLLPE
ncbi:hypothetical protein [Psychroserpens mesophilus]|uniref:hypothetical protein n=1 Tax=Psychroserpens mesophilus TaxID=325473 RepID=UPI00058C8029|nr:hypothetical protein [Psychroserpens mesophilus]